MPEPDPVESSPAGARLARWAGGDRNLALLAATVAVLPLVVGMVRVLVDGQFALHGDDALIELRVRDVGSHTPLVGSYQRFGWNHPGPLLFYLLAAPYRLLGSDFSGLQVGALAVNALSVVGIGFVAQRRGGLPLLLWSLALVALLVHAIGPVDLSDPWEPDVSVLPVTLLVFLAWDVASGRVWALPVVAAVASLLVQAYAVLAPVTLALSGGAAVTLAVGWLRDRRRAPADRRWRGAMAAGIVAGLVVVVAWTPPVIEELRDGRGNVSQTLDFFRTPQDTLGLGDAWSAMTLQFDHRALWFGGDLPLATFSSVVDLGDGPRLPVAAVALVAATAVAAWRRQRAALLGATVLVGVAAGVVGLSRLVGDLFPWILQWTAVLGLGSWLATGWCAWCSLSARARAALARPLVPVLTFALVATSAVNVTDGVTGERDTRHIDDVVLGLAEEGAAEVDAVGGPVLVRSVVEVRSVFGRGGLAELLVLSLERAGVEVLVEERFANLYGRHRAQPDRAVAELRLVNDDDRPDAGFRTVASIDPLEPAERAEKERLRAVLDELGTLPDLIDAVRRDPELRAVAERYNEIEDLPPLALRLRAGG